MIKELICCLLGCLYPNNIKSWDFGLAKASGLDDLKRVHISNIEPFKIVQSQELSLKPKPNFLCCLGIPLIGQDLADPTTTFTFSLYSQANKPGTNVVLSPYSIFICLAMPYMGANNATAEAMESALHFSMELDELASAIASGMKNYTEVPQSEKGYQLNIANSLWIAQNFEILDTFRRPIMEQFQATVQTVDFRCQEASSEQINSWISFHTQGKISHLLDNNDVSADTRLVLANAIYFKGSWARPFDANMTKIEPFWIDANSCLDASMMEQTAHFLYYESEKFQLVALPFIGQWNGSPELAYVMLLPKESSELQLIEENLSASDFQTWISSLRTAKVHLKCPKFVLNERTDLQSMLTTLGMGIAFTPYADFSGIDGGRDLYINKVLHQTFFSVDEAGVTAAAATAISMNVTTAYTPPMPTVAFIADHPFLFFLIDMNTKTPLFMGKFNEPDVNGS